MWEITNYLNEVCVFLSLSPYLCYLKQTELSSLLSLLYRVCVWGCIDPYISISLHSCSLCVPSVNFKWAGCHGSWINLPQYRAGITLATVVSLQIIQGPSIWTNNWVTVVLMFLK